jgi:hypothetical protein
MPDLPSGGIVGTQAAIIACDLPEFIAIAEAIAAAARVEAAKHTDTGAFLASIHVEKVAGKRGVTDRQVVADSPDALWVEYGHVASGWYADIAPGTWIPGYHILRNAAKPFGGYE